MRKQTSPLRELFRCTLQGFGRRVYFAVWRQFCLTPVIFYTCTRTRAGAGALRTCTQGGRRTVGLPAVAGRPLRLRRTTAVAVLGLATVMSLSLTLFHPADATTSSQINFQARLETSNGAIVNDGNYNVEF